MGLSRLVLRSRVEPCSHTDRQAWSNDLRQIGLIEEKEAAQLSQAKTSQQPIQQAETGVNKTSSTPEFCTSLGVPSDPFCKKLGKIALFAAVERGDAKEVEELLARFVGHAHLTNKTDYKGRTALHLAVELGHEDVVKVLIDREIDVFAEDGCGLTALQIAVELGHEKITERLIRKKPGLAFDNGGLLGWSCLHLAILGRHIAVIKRLLAVDVGLLEMCDGFRQNPVSALQLAVDYGLEDVLTALIESGYGPRVLARAIAAGNDTLVVKLLAQSPHLLDPTPHYGTLNLAVQYGQDVIVTRLLALNPSLMNPTVLYDAISTGHETIVDLLLAHSPHLIDSVEVLQRAAARGRNTIVARVLAANPALASRKCLGERNALHWAAQGHHVKVVEQLLALNPELINVMDSTCRTALHIALSHLGNECAATVECLLAHGAVFDAKALWIVLSGARTASDDQFVKMLITRKPELVGIVCPPHLGSRAEEGSSMLHCMFGGRKCAPYCKECERFGSEGDAWCENCRRKIPLDFFSEDLVLTVWQMISRRNSPEEALRATDCKHQTPFYYAVLEQNTFAIELVQWKLSLDEIVQTYREILLARREFPPCYLNAIREVMLLVYSLNKDVVGTVCDYLLIENKLIGSRRKTKTKNNGKEKHCQPPSPPL